MHAPPPHPASTRQMVAASSSVLSRKIGTHQISFEMRGRQLVAVAIAAMVATVAGAGSLPGNIMRKPAGGPGLACGNSRGRLLALFCLPFPTPSLRGGKTPTKAQPTTSGKRALRPASCRDARFVRTRTCLSGRGGGEHRNEGTWRDGDAWKSSVDGAQFEANSLQVLEEVWRDMTARALRACGDES